MTTANFKKTLVSIVRDLPLDYAREERYQRLVTAMKSCFPFDAGALLQLVNGELKPLAVMGLSRDTLGRRFEVSEHPRLEQILLSRSPVRFPADSKLPDPYDGLVEVQQGVGKDDGYENTHNNKLNVHDCMGMTLYIDEKPWGILTLDANKPGTFDDIDPLDLEAFIAVTEATVKTALRIEVLQTRVSRQKEAAKIERDTRSKNEIIGQCESIKRLKTEMDIVAQSHLSVLILGETGVGKELVARYIHAHSGRSDQPLIYVNCAALPENIAESELFGHLKGAFTGAEMNRSGKFELADKGTLFLDEIGELPLSIQAKLLRVLQSGEVQRVGSDKYLEVDVRVVAATNRNLKKAVEDGRFRSDLYHRLSVYPLSVPPLRERVSDILLLAGNILEKNQHRFGVQGLRLSDNAKQILMRYSWPGNVRELSHLLSRAALKAINKQVQGESWAVIQEDDLGIDRDDLSGDEHVNVSGSTVSINKVKQFELPKNLSLKEATEYFQRSLIQDALNNEGGNLAAAARELGLNRSNFYRLVKRLKGVEEV